MMLKFLRSLSNCLLKFEKVWNVTKEIFKTKKAQAWKVQKQHDLYQRGDRAGDRVGPPQWPQTPPRPGRADVCVCICACAHLCNPQPLREMSTKLRGWPGWASLGIGYREVFRVFSAFKLVFVKCLVLWFIRWTPDIDLQCTGHWLPVNYVVLIN